VWIGKSDHKKKLCSKPCSSRAAAVATARQQQHPSSSSIVMQWAGGIQRTGAVTGRPGMGTEWRPWWVQGEFGSCVAESTIMT